MFKFTKRVTAVAAGLLMTGGMSVALGGTSMAAIPPLSVSLSADGNGSAVFNSVGDPVLTLGSTGTYAQMAVNLPAGSMAPVDAPSFNTTAYAAGSPRWVIELANGDLLDSNQTGSPGAPGGWEYDAGDGWQGYGDTYAQALAVVDADNAVQVTSAYIVEDGDQAAGTSDTLSKVQYNAQYLPGVVTVENPGSQSWTVGKAASLQVGASTSASDTALSYSAASLPAGLAINSSTGLISGTPTTAQSYTTTVTVDDAYGDQGTQTFTWTTGNPVVTLPPPPVCTTTGNAQSATAKPAHLTDSASGAREYFAWSMPCDVTGAAWFTSIYKDGRLMDTKVTDTNSEFYGALVKGAVYTVNVRWNDPGSPASSITFTAA